MALSQTKCNKPRSCSGARPESRLKLPERRRPSQLLSFLDLIAMRIRYALDLYDVLGDFRIRQSSLLQGLVLRQRTLLQALDVWNAIECLCNYEH